AFDTDYTFLIRKRRAHHPILLLRLHNIPYTDFYDKYSFHHTDSQHSSYIGKKAIAKDHQQHQPSANGVSHCTYHQWLLPGFYGHLYPSRAINLDKFIRKIFIEKRYIHPGYHLHYTFHSFDNSLRRGDKG